MAYTFAILALMLTSTTAFSLLNETLEVVEDAGNAVKSTVATVKEPIDKSVGYIVNSLCEEVRELLGLDYEQTNDTEPDLSQLTLIYETSELNATFKLLTAAETLPKTQEIDLSRPLVVVIHGFIDDPSIFAFPLINGAFQSIGTYNVLGLDASSLIRFLYLRASSVVRFIGEALGATLAGLVDVGLDPKAIYLVGHSLGAHIAGIAGKSFFNSTGLKIGRISGLDPAGPCFTNVGDDQKLNATDAEFVDVIHTDGGVYGLKDPVGHVDFFPNGGEQQPNCVVQFCSHLRVVELFAESVQDPRGFPATRCSSWNDFKEEQCSNDTSLMGYGCQNGTVEGLYYLRTEGGPPYALNATTNTTANQLGVGLDPKDIYLVGHSLGAHIAGFAGKSFFNSTGLKIGRISGLDPAGPCFTNVGDDQMLNATDAEFVDAIHTDGGVYGLKDPVGHVDFFPNGGEKQPNCVIQFCSHLRVVELFAESVQDPRGFPATRCSSWDDFKEGHCSNDTSLMGYGCQKGTVEGLYYLRTEGERPYALNATTNTTANQLGGAKGAIFQIGRDIGVL